MDANPIPVTAIYENMILLFGEFESKFGLMPTGDRRKNAVQGNHMLSEKNAKPKRKGSGFFSSN